MRILFLLLKTFQLNPEAPDVLVVPTTTPEEDGEDNPGDISEISNNVTVETTPVGVPIK